MSIPGGRRRTARLALVYTGALVAGYLLDRLGVPLPWMIGPMLVSAGAAIAGRMERPPVMTRSIGQTIVSGSVGLYFTGQALEAMAAQFGAMIAVALSTILAGFLVAALLMRLVRIDVISACLCSIPCGPVETAQLAERYGVPPAPVAFAQIMRVAFLVLTIPPVVVWLTPGGGGPVGPMIPTVEGAVGSATMLAIAICGGQVFKRLRLNSPYFLGGLAFVALASTLEVPMAPLPFPVLAAGQVLLGVWLGGMFDRRILASSRDFAGAAVISTVSLLVLCFGMAAALVWSADMPWQAAVLATAPGSTTEMALTAKILQIDVALVTAFHVTRIFIILPFAPLIFAGVHRVTGVSPGGTAAPAEPTAAAPATGCKSDRGGKG